jgi:hypothetical protein
MASLCYWIIDKNSSIVVLNGYIKEGTRFIFFETFGAPL